MRPSASRSTAGSQARAQFLGAAAGELDEGLRVGIDAVEVRVDEDASVADALEMPTAAKV